ncbi:RNA-directed DNA polymerase from mobile element jockeylike [hydra vulgaris] [Plakobranchus ocellatus]|uniref:RNA-directed DNA polymerase from mobile element jockeylike [hydra vulgaris] n=1 Tax=Plakobranchus ocellatus TaxID=259542 RepID=A0AAV3ZRT2_9GAST|nr:RNA-directed DNA polymerase from mobile element jockeylike [hydra vulgaris] [Plakobranchus ocellatus]
MNVKSLYEDQKQNDPHRAAIPSPHDKQLQILTDFAHFADKLKGFQGKRIKKLTVDTATAIYHTCLSVVEMTKSLLHGNQFVLLEKFTTDPLEKAFGKLRQGSEGTYFINVQQTLEKVNMMKTKLALRMDLGVSDLSTESGHVCEKCVVYWTHEMCEMVEELPNMEYSVKDDVKYSLVFIAGYVIRKDKEVVEDSCSYFEKFGTFTLSPSRGGLVQAGDSACQWTIFFLYDVPVSM